MSVLRPDLMMKCVVPVIMAGIIAVSIVTPKNAYTHQSNWLVLPPCRSMVLSSLSLFPAHVCRYPCPHCWSFSLTQPTVEVEMSLAASFIYLGAGLSVGLAGLAAGFAIGIVGDAGVRGTAQQPRLFVGMVRLHIHKCAVGADPDGNGRFWFSFSPKCWVFTDSSSRLLWTLRLTIWLVS